jgi:GAF domain-containing protein
MKDLVLSTAGSSLPSWAEIRLDGRVLVFTFVISILTGLLFGLVPALHGARSDLGRSLKEGGAQVGSGEGKARFRRLLVAGQVALSVVLLAGAGLLLQSLWRLLHVDTGFKTKNVVTLQISLPQARYPEPEQIAGFYDRLLERIKPLPGLRQAGLVNILPLSGGYSGDSFLVDEHAAVVPGQEPTAEHRCVSEGYFEALGVPLLRDDVEIGVLVLYRFHVEPFSERQIDLVQTFADQAVIAIENARLLGQLRDREAELRVTFDNMADGVAMFDDGLRLAAWNRNFQELLQLPESVLADRPEFDDYIRYLAERGEFGATSPEAEIARLRARLGDHYSFERTRPDGTRVTAPPAASRCRPRCRFP